MIHLLIQLVGFGIAFGVLACLIARIAEDCEETQRNRREWDIRHGRLRAALRAWRPDMSNDARQVSQAGVRRIVDEMWRSWVNNRHVGESEPLPCPWCGGDGYQDTQTDEPCRRCKGDGYVR